MSILIQNGQIIDGTGAAAFDADVLIDGDRIVAVGKALSASGAKKLDASGCWVTPGFINMHSHSDCAVAMSPCMESSLGQGVTTEFAGHCGLGVAPVPEHWIYMFPEKQAFTRVMPEPIGGINPYDFYTVPTERMRKAFREAYGEALDWTTYGEFIRHLRRRGIGANLALVAGQANIRLAAMGLDFRRPATGDEILSMEASLEEAMASGARGLGLGLDYQPGLFASREELFRLMKKTAALGGVVTAHTRSRTHPSYGRNVCFRDGLEEFLQLGLETGVPIHVCHIQNAYDVSPADDAMIEAAVGRTLDMLDDYRSRGVRVTWDVIPRHLFGPFHYPMAASMFQPYVEQCGGVEAFSRMLKVGNYRSRVEDDIRDGRHPSRGVFTRFNPKDNPRWDLGYVITLARDGDLVGKTLRDAAGGRDSLTFLMDALEVDPHICVMPLSRRPSKAPDRDAFASREEACIGLDTWTFSYAAALNAPGMPLECGSPATYCGMTEFLCDRRAVEPPWTTIRKLTGNPAQALGLTDRGLVRTGLVADLLVIDPDALSPDEHAGDPRQAPAGMRAVIVSGSIAMRDGTPTGALAGNIL